MDLLQLQQNFETIDVWEVLKPILEKHLDKAEQLNREQLLSGLAADGSETPPHKGSPMSNLYVDSKIERGIYNQSIYPSVNLFNTGEFHKSIKAIVEDFGIGFDSLDDKFAELEGRYGTTITGLNQESVGKWIESWKGEFIEALKNAILK